MSKKVFVQTLGCAMNVRDSERMVALLQDEDYELCKDHEEADLILINTCSVRERPVHKLFSELGGFHKSKKKGAKIGVCGCSASHLGSRIIKRAPYVDFVLGARNISRINEAVNTPNFVANDINYDESEFAFKDFRKSIYKSFINISIGCDKKCAYCIVPNTRGEEISIPLKLILNEAQKALEAGAKELFLLGQNVNNYGKHFTNKHEKINFSKLLNRLSKLDGLERIRFTSPHPLHMDDEFLDEFTNNPKICKAMHMPLQSGSDEILRLMRRGYTKEWFLKRALKLRKMCPQASISTDIIVGFPLESEEDFRHTLEVMEEVRFEQIFSFKYSKRELTTAAVMEGQVPDEVSGDRLSRLQNRQDEILDEIAAAQMGKTYEVYFEETRPGGKIAGRSDNNFLIMCEGGEDLLGGFKNVKITNPRRMVLNGEITL